MWKSIKKYVGQLFDVYCREFKIVLHDEGIMLFFLFLPLAYPIIYSLIYNPEGVRDGSMVVVDHDRSAKSRELVRSIDATEEA
ncbi:MAG: ABC transporter permease, partial [Muribaculaceae bacterium]|nr:ABC transporter permease [Muribaculaceae bacterium]